MTSNNLRVLINSPVGELNHTVLCLTFKIITFLPYKRNRHYGHDITA